MTAFNRIAAIANRNGQDSQALLSELAANWRVSGVRVAGLLAQDSDVANACSAAFLKDIASGVEFSIQLDAPPLGTACHLNTDGMGTACAKLLPQIADADIVLLSKFGKTEAGGQGLIEAFRQTIAAGKPVLTTVSAKHFSAWEKFAPDAIWLESDLQSVERWRHTASA